MENKKVLMRRAAFLGLLAFLLWGSGAEAAKCEPNAEYFCNPLNLGGEGNDTLADFVVLAVKALLALIGFFSFFFLITGGMRYITAAGSEESMQSAKHTVTSAITGLAIALASWGLVIALEKMLQV